jgi:hypothetical protein
VALQQRRKRARRMRDIAAELEGEANNHAGSVKALLIAAAAEIRRLRQFAGVVSEGDGDFNQIKQQRTR